MNIFCKILLPIDRVHAILADFGKIFKLIPQIDRVIEVNVAAIVTIVSTDSIILLKVLYFLYIFWLRVSF